MTNKKIIDHSKNIIKDISGYNFKYGLSNQLYFMNNPDELTCKEDKIFVIKIKIAVYSMAIFYIPHDNLLKENQSLARQLVFDN